MTNMKTAIIGLGYVGLPLSLQFARSGVMVLGLDIDPAKVDAINQGRSYIKHIESAAIAEAGQVRRILRLHRFQPDQGGGGGHHLRARRR